MEKNKNNFDYWINKGPFPMHPNCRCFIVGVRIYPELTESKRLAFRQYLYSKRNN